MKNSITIKRVKAFLVDYLVILLYIGLLLGVTLLSANIFHLSLANTNPITGELVAFITLVLPVVLYFTFSENGRYGGTVGKRKYRLKVLTLAMSQPSIGRLLVRNLVKFLPWELAHFFIYRLYFFTSANQPTPGWVMSGLFVAQGLALFYLLCIIITRNHRTVYEWLSGTKVACNEGSPDDYNEG